MLFAALLVLFAVRYFANSSGSAVTHGTLPTQPNTPQASMDGCCIAIDPGHGGIDSGAVGTDTGVTEASLNLQIGMLLETKFSQAGMGALMTRTSNDVDYSGAGDTDKIKDMNNRAKLVNRQDPEALVSIHMNTFADRSVKGAQVFFQQGSEKGQALAACIQDELNASVNTEKSRTPQPGDFYLLKAVSCPAVIVECGFLSNPEDEANLQNPQYQGQLADCIYEGVCGFLDVKS